MATPSLVSDSADADVPAGAAPARDARPAVLGGGSLITPLLPLLQVMRPYQWVKNLLLALPLVMSHQIDDRKIYNVVMAIVAFCLCASSAYVLNDLRDADDDRHHPVKRDRPFASGRLGRGAGFLLAALLLLAGFAVSGPLLPRKFTALLGAYVVATLAYSFWLKRKLLVDVFVLAGLYTLRVLAGGAAVHIDVSHWLLAFCIFFFLSLAFAKRYAELRRVEASEDKTVRGRGYQLEDLAVLESVGPASGYMAVLVLALYVNSSTALSLYSRPFLLWLVCPLILYWVTRVWFLARRGSLSEDPVLFSLKDRISLLVAGLTMLLIILASGWPRGLGF